MCKRGVKKDSCWGKRLSLPAARFCILVLFMLHGLSGFSNAQLAVSECKPGWEPFRGQVKEITETTTNSGTNTRFIRVQKFDEFGKLTERNEGSNREYGATEIEWRSKSTYVYDELARLVSITEVLLLNPPIQLESEKTILLLIPHFLLLSFETIEEPQKEKSW